MEMGVPGSATEQSVGRSSPPCACGCGGGSTPAHCGGLQPARRVASVGETQSGPLPSSGEGIWRCLSLIQLSSVEVIDGPWRTEPHAPQRCVENIEVDADDYPGGDPQNGQ